MADARVPVLGATGGARVSGVFALTTPFEAGVHAEVRQGRAIVAVARQARVPHLLFSSVAGAGQHTGVSHFESKGVIETEIATAGVPYTILGPTYLFDNALGGTDQILGGVLELPLPSDRPLQRLARPDLGTFAAEVLTHPDRYLSKRIELASDAPTPAKMATALSGAMGRPVRHQPVPLDAIGNPDMHAMWKFLNGRRFVAPRFSPRSPSCLCRRWAGGASRWGTWPRRWGR